MTGKGYFPGQWWQKCTILKVCLWLLPWRVAVSRQVWSRKGLECCLVAFQQVASLPNTHSGIFSLLSLLPGCRLRVNAVIVNASEKKCSMCWNCTLSGHCAFQTAVCGSEVILVFFLRQPHADSSSLMAAYKDIFTSLEKKKAHR